MAGFKFEVGIKKGIRVVKYDELQFAKGLVLSQIGFQIQNDARALARMRAPGSIYGKGSNTGTLAESIKVEDSTSKSGNTLYKRVYVDESKTRRQTTPGTGRTPIATSYARFQEFGTGIHSLDPNSPKDWIRPKKKRMVWVQYGRPYRSPTIKARSLSYRIEQVAPPSRRRRIPESRPRMLKHQSRHVVVTTNEGPWQQIATAVQGVRPKSYMRLAAKHAAEDAAMWNKTLRKMADEFRLKLIGRVS